MTAGDAARSAPTCRRPDGRAVATALRPGHARELHMAADHTRHRDRSTGGGSAARPHRSGPHRSDHRGDRFPRHARHRREAGSCSARRATGDPRIVRLPDGRHAAAGVRLVILTLGDAHNVDGAPLSAARLLITATTALATNIVTFALLYWQIDG